MALSIGGEHRVHMPTSGAGQAGKGATPEKLLNAFVRSVALIERLGNALGTLAFTWATVILLGGYPTVLRPQDDFWFATTIVLLEAVRMFSSNNRLDYQLFFNTRGAFRPLGWNGLTVVGIYSSVLVFLINYFSLDGIGMPLLMAMLLVVGRFLSPGLVKLLTRNLARRAISLWSPLVPVLFLGLSVLREYNFFIDEEPEEPDDTKLVAFLVVLVLVLLLTISRLQFPSIIKLVDRVLGSKKVLWHRVILNMCMLATGVMLVFMLDDSDDRSLIIIFAVSAAAIISLGNFQIPAAVVRVVLALVRLIPHYYYGDDEKIDSNNLGDKTNLAPSLNIFYGMILGQGILYGLACIIGLFSFIPRRSLARRGGFRGRWGVESVNLYYAYAFEKCVQGDVLAPKKINLSNFAMDSINSDTPKMQLHGIRMMHSLLQREPTRKRLISKLNASMETMTRLINMLDWKSPENTTVRLFAAKVTAELAASLRIITIPGIIQVLSTLLDSGNQHKRGNPLLDADVEHEKIPDPVLNAHNNQKESLSFDPVLDTGSPLEIEDHSTQQVGSTEQKPWKLRCCQRISEFWSIHEEEPLGMQDLLPALGMTIIYGIASCDQDNCLEISGANGLISKIIGFTSYRRTDTMYTDTQWKVIVESSLKLLQRLTSIDGEIGITLRHKISKHPFFLRNLAEILGDSTSSQELRNLVAGILKNLAIDANTRHHIGRIQAIITRLMQIFLSTDKSSSSDTDRLLPKVAAGQALAMLAMDNADNCLAMLKGTGYVFIKELTSMICADRYRCVAASLLRSMCLHARTELKDTALKELSYCLREVLERILVSDGPELEILVGLSSQICQVIPGDFAKALEDSQVKQAFVKRLVDMLNANMAPSGHCPGIRRMILEQVINMMEYNPGYTDFFYTCGMAEALSMVEETASEAENYSFILGNAGLMEASQPLPSLVARAKQLLIARRT